MLDIHYGQLLQLLYPPEEGLLHLVIEVVVYIVMSVTIHSLVECHKIAIAGKLTALCSQVVIYIGISDYRIQIIHLGILNQRYVVLWSEDEEMWLFAIVITVLVLREPHCVVVIAAQLFSLTVLLYAVDI